MFPMEFDYRILSTLPVPDDERIKEVAGLLKAVVLRRVLQYFKNKRGTDPIRLAQVGQDLSIERMEDDGNSIRLVSAVFRAGESWSVGIHERIFDFLSFVIPSDPESRLGNGSPDEHKMLAFAEFVLRHQTEHILYPSLKERDIVRSDVNFAVALRTGDPTSYRMLRHSLSDEMIGIKGEHYLALFDAAEQGAPLDPLIGTILNTLVVALSDVPGEFLSKVFNGLDTEIKGRISAEYYRKSTNTANTLLQRTRALRTALSLLAGMHKANENEAWEVLSAFKERWGLVGLLHELDLPEHLMDEKAPRELMGPFFAAVAAHLEEGPSPAAAQPYPGPRVEPQAAGVAARPEKSLKDRIEEARGTPRFPPRVIEVMDKNKLNTVGHSGSKYSELIETLLAIPWGRIRPIRVSPEEFEQGLNRTHYGLHGPKEILCDFFTNLIWRYGQFSEAEAASWRRTGSAFLLVGPPGVGKTSLAISVAQNLDIPYHKISLGGMRDEADIRGHGFTYEGSKPGSIVQGLIKMEAMNGMFILDEADKTEKFAIATLLEILDPEQNHLFHDKYTETTLDIDLSNCHFFLTANTLEAVPQVVVNRCEVVLLDRYSVEEKIAIARQYLIHRVRAKYQIDEKQIFFDPEREEDLLRYLVRSYTYEAGVRELERIIRTLFLRLQRKEIFGRGREAVQINREAIKQYLEEPSRPRQISEEDAVGEMLGLGVDLERGVGSVIPIQATRMGLSGDTTGAGGAHLSIVHATGNIEKVMDESRKVATTGILSCSDRLGIVMQRVEEPIHLHFMGGSTRKDGPSAGGAIALALASLLSGRKIRRDVAMTGEIDTRGRITGVGALAMKIETAHNAGCRTVIIPKENLNGQDSIERLPEALKAELQILAYEEWAGAHDPFDHARHMLQVVAVDDIVQASRVASIEEAELDHLGSLFEPYAREVADQVRRLRTQPVHLSRIIQVKSTDELDPELIAIPEGDVRGDLTLLAPPDLREAILLRLAESGSRIRVLDFDPRLNELSRILQQILAMVETAPAAAVRVSLIAPYFFLKRDGIVADDIPVGPGTRGITLFANNYTVQEVKIKSCKPVLNRVYSLLSCLDPSTLDSCPFLGRRNSTHVIDLSFIPEMYRLDVKRAEKILSRCLTQWLGIVERLAAGAEA